MLESELSRLRAELAAARRLLALYQTRDLRDLEPPPPELEAALHARCDRAAIRISAARREIVIIRDGGPREHDPVREADDWRRIREAIQS